VESATQRDDRIRTLEQRRESRRADSVWPTPDKIGAVEVAPGRGDLNYSSSFVYQPVTALQLIGSQSVSFARLFQSQPWVAAAVMRMLTWAIRVPLVAYRRKDDPNDRTPLGIGDHPIADMIAKPWDRGNAAQLIMNLLGPVLVHGNSTIVVDDTQRSGAVQLTPKDWRFARPLMPWRDSLEGFSFDVDDVSQKRDYSIDKVLHVAWWSPTGPIGTSPLMQLGVTMQVEDAAQRYQKSLFAWGGRPPTAVVASESFLELRPNERSQIMKQLRSDLNEIYGGPDKSGKPALLPPGLDWKTIGQTTVEAALIDQRKIAREEVCAVYQIPPPMLGILERATFSNIETQREMVYTECLGPPLVLIEQAINAQLIRDLLHEDDVFVEFDFAGVLRGDRLKQITAIRDAIASALLSPNEGRNLLGEPSVDDEQMDQYWLPTNNLTSITGDDPAFAPQPPAPQPQLPVPGQVPVKPPPPVVPVKPAPPKQPPQGRLHVVSNGREYVLEEVHE
jgi:HK97 family phage portal protein